MDDPRSARPSFYPISPTHGQLAGCTKLDIDLLACVFIEHRRILKLRQPEKKLKETDLDPAEALTTVCVLLCMAAAFVRVDRALHGGFEIEELRKQCKRLGAERDPNSDLRKILRKSPALDVPGKDSDRIVLATIRVGSSVGLDDAAFNACDKALTTFGNLF